MNNNPVTKAIELIGLQSLASNLGITYQAVKRWERNFKMPRSEYTGETKYSEVIERLTNRKVTKKQLLAMRLSSLNKNQ